MRLGAYISALRARPLARGLGAVDVPVENLPDHAKPWWKDDSVSNGKGRHYRVTSYNDSGGAPNAPSNPKATGGDSEVVVSWDEVPGAAGYKVYRSDNPGIEVTPGENESLPSDEVTATPGTPEQHEKTFQGDGDPIGVSWINTFVTPQHTFADAVQSIAFTGVSSISTTQDAATAASAHSGAIAFTSVTSISTSQDPDTVVSAHANAIAFAGVASISTAQAPDPVATPI